MSEESPLSRRRLLAAVGSVGALSTAGASASLGLLGDGEGFAATADGGTVELDLGCSTEGVDCTDGRNRLTVPFDGLEPGGSGSRRLSVGVAEGSNPVYLWLRGDCPAVGDALATTLEVEVSVVRRCESATSKTVPLVERTTLADALRELRSGVALAGVDAPTATEECLGPDDRLCLDVDYWLPDGTEWLAGATTDLDLRFAALQCRHVSESDVETPFEDRSCPTLSCPDCVELGKVDVENDRLRAGETYEFTEFYNGYGDDDPTYRLAIPTVTEKVGDDGRETVCASFGLLRAGEGNAAPPICRVDVFGAGETAVYDGDRVDPPATRTRGEVCTDRDANPNPGRPAISNVTVYVCPGVTTDG